MGLFDSPSTGIIKRLPVVWLPIALGIVNRAQGIFEDDLPLQNIPKIRREAIVGVVVGTWANAHALCGNIALDLRTNSWIVKQSINWSRFFREDDEQIFRAIMRVMIREGVMPEEFELSSVS